MVTITVVSLGFYMLSYPESTRRKQFRMLVGLIGLSIVQDVLWFILNRDTEDDEDDGGLERGVKSFARTLSFVSLVWRVSESFISELILFSVTDSCRYRLLEDLIRLRARD